MYLLAEREPTIVSDTGDAAVYRPIIVDAGRSRSYVAAPVIAGDEVVGFLHADHLPSSRRVDETDRDALWAFADGFGRIYERTVLLERLRAQRDQVREMLASTDDMLDEMCGPGIDLRAAADRVAPRPVEADGGAVAARLRELTTREREVLGLMAAGLTNPAIAERLVISEDTVKTHVKHVLRKLGAANRAKAIAMASGVRGTGGPQA
jgi:DNA-binding CsgD family transcriptional regulator